jgi:hypothetical protein
MKVHKQKLQMHMKAVCGIWPGIPWGTFSAVGAMTTQPSSGAEIDLARLSETIGITMHIHKEMQVTLRQLGPLHQVHLLEVVQYVVRVLFLV